MNTFEDAARLNVNDFRTEISRGANYTECTLINYKNKWVFKAYQDNRSRLTILRMLNNYDLRSFNSLTAAYNYIKDKLGITTVTVRPAEKHEKLT